MRYRTGWEWFQPRKIRPPRHCGEMVQNPAAAFRTSLFPLKTPVASGFFQYQRSEANPTNNTLFISEGLGIRRWGFQCWSSLKSTEVPSLLSCWSWKDHQTLPYPLDWPVWKVPRGLLPWSNSPLRETAVLSVSSTLIEGTSSLVSSQTNGSGTAATGCVVSSRMSSALIAPPWFSPPRHPSPCPERSCRLAQEQSHWQLPLGGLRWSVLPLGWWRAGTPVRLRQGSSARHCLLVMPLSISRTQATRSRRSRSDVMSVRSQ